VREGNLKIAIEIAAIAVFLLIWQLVATMQLLALPTVAVTFAALETLLIHGEPVMGRTLFQHASASVARVLDSSLIAFGAAIPLGIAIGWYRRFEYFANTLIEVFRPIPPLAWIPLAYVLFMAYGNTVLLAQLFIVALAVFFPTAVTIIAGVKAVDPILIDAARMLGANERQLITKVVFAAIIPAVFTGVRIGLGVGWAAIVAAELIGGSGTGLGYFIMTMYNVGGRMPEIISGIIVIGVIGFFMNEAILFIQRRVAGWA
jgi:NitT/TauT family transport system permease protein